MRQDGFAHPGRRRGRADGAGGEHRTARVGRLERVECPPGGVGAVDHHCGERLAQGGLDRGLPTVVDLDEIEQCAEHTVDLGQSLRSGAGMSRVEGELQRLDPSARTRRLLIRVGTSRDRTLDLGIGRCPITLGRRDLIDEWDLDLFGLGTVASQVLGIDVELLETAGQFLTARRRPSQLALVALDAAAHRPQLATDLGGGARRLRAPGGIVEQRGSDPLPFGAERGFVGLERLGVGIDRRERGRDFVEFGPEACGVGLEVGDDACVEERAVIALERPLALGEDAPRAPGRAHGAARPA